MGTNKELSQIKEVFWLLVVLTIGTYFFSFMLFLYLVWITIFFIPKVNWKIKWAIWVIVLLFSFWAWTTYKVPEIKVLSNLENNKNSEYNLVLDLKNTTKLYINSEEQNFSWEKFEKKIELKESETKINVIAKNSIFQEKTEEIIIKRDKTETEIQTEKENEEKIKQEEAKKEEERKKELPKQVWEKDKTKYWVDCKASVKNLLNFPKTADFPLPKYFYNWTPWKEAIIKWTVTSQNAFWVTLESYYECVFTWNAEKEEYTYKYLIE